MEQGPDELNEQTTQGAVRGADTPGVSQTAGAQPAGGDEPESLDDTAAQRPPSDS